MSAATAPVDQRVERAWNALAAVEDPEIPGLHLVDLGIIRFIHAQLDGTLLVGLSPTYTGCPATDVIRSSVADALASAGIADVMITEVLSPAWTSDWITAEGRRQLASVGIVPPARATTLRDLMHESRPIACPRCMSLDTETVSEFGSTPCKALHRCRACLEPFEYFKCI